METQYNTTISFFSERDFGDLIGTPFTFLKQEFKPFMAVMLRYVAPFLAAGILSQMIFMQNLDDGIPSISSGFLATSGSAVGLSTLTALISNFLLVLLTNSYITLYANYGAGQFSTKDVWKHASKFIGQYIGATLLILGIVIPAFFFFLIPGIYLIVALSFTFIVISNEDSSAGKAISRSFQVIKNHWWFTFGQFIIFGLITITISLTIQIPHLIFGYSTVSTIFSLLINLIITMFIYPMQNILIGFLYFNYTGKKEGVNLDNKIDAIYKTEDTEKDSTEQKSKIEDYYPELSDEPSWSEPKKTEKSNTQNTPKENQKKDKKEDDFDRYRKKENDYNRFFDTDDDDDRFKPKY